MRQSKGIVPVSREYLSVRELSYYSGISERTLWDLLKDPANPIPYFRFGSAGRIIRVRKCDFDSWADGQRGEESAELVDGLVSELLEGR